MSNYKKIVICLMACLLSSGLCAEQVGELFGESPLVTDIMVTTTQHDTVPTRSTLALIKPDAVAKGKIGDIVRIIELNGFIIRRMEMRQLSLTEVQEFYEAHKERDYFASLLDFMMSAPVVALVLEHKDAETDVVKAWRACMGATNPNRAKVGTVRYIFGSSIQHNAVHGSDSKESAEREIALIFGNKETSATSQPDIFPRAGDNMVDIFPRKGDVPMEIDQSELMD